MNFELQGIGRLDIITFPENPGVVNTMRLDTAHGSYDLMCHVPMGWSVEIGHRVDLIDLESQTIQLIHPERAEWLFGTMHEFGHMRDIRKGNLLAEFTHLYTKKDIKPENLLPEEMYQIVSLELRAWKNAIFLVKEMGVKEEALGKMFSFIDSEEGVLDYVNSYTWDEFEFIAANGFVSPEDLEYKVKMKYKRWKRKNFI